MCIRDRSTSVRTRLSAPFMAVGVPVYPVRPIMPDCTRSLVCARTAAGSSTFGVRMGIIQHRHGTAPGESDARVDTIAVPLGGGRAHCKHCRPRPDLAHPDSTHHRAT